jgi:hypothetical protein
MYTRHQSIDYHMVQVIDTKDKSEVLCYHNVILKVQ